MRLSTKQRGYFDALGVLICEVSLLVVFLRANSLLGTVDLSHFTTWLRTTSPERAVTASAAVPLQRRRLSAVGLVAEVGP